MGEGRHTPILKTIEAVIEKDGHVRLLEEVRLSRSRRALVTILDDEREAGEPALLSEAAFAEDWRRDQEEEAWGHLQQEH
jgi:hypothetical protein